MNTTLAEVLTALGIPHKPRYSIEEVAEILGIRRDQVIDLLRKGRLVGMRSSMHRWRCVFATELDAFIQKINAPRQVTKKESNPSGGSPGRKADLTGVNTSSFQELMHTPFDLTDLMDLPTVSRSVPVSATGSSVKLGGRDLDL